jgi:cytochrome P450
LLRGGTSRQTDEEKMSEAVQTDRGIHFDPHSEAALADPHSFYKRLRDEAPAYYNEEYDCWFLSRFEDIWRCEMDLDSFTASEGLMPMQLAATAEEKAIMDQMFEDRDRGSVIAAMDPPEHTRMRSILSPPFKPGAVKKLEPYTRQLVRSFVGQFVERGRCDVVADLAMRTSVRVACRIGGLPVEEADWFTEKINAHFQRNPGQRGMTAEGRAATLELNDWLSDFVTRARVDRPTRDCVLNTLLDAELGGRRLGDAAVQGNLFLLLIGGTETLPKVLSAAVYRLAQHPEQRAELASDLSLAPHAFQEALRYDMPTQSLGRRMLKEKEIHGQLLRPGQGILYLWASGNRDEREFPDPDRFDIHRRARRILSFGAGPHMCLGAHVARMEARVMLEELLARIPEYRVMEDRVVRLRSELFQGITALPIEFDPC